MVKVGRNFFGNFGFWCCGLKFKVQYTEFLLLKLKVKNNFKKMQHKGR